jgi:hypothetical protein
MVRLPVCAAILSALVLTACSSGEGAYPSLARRPAERVLGSAPVVTPEPAVPLAPPPASADTTSRLARLTALAREAHARFAARRGRAEQLVSAAAGAAVASEAWAVATVALAELESARSEAMIALADLDAMHAAAEVAAGGSPNGDAAAIAAARSSVIALVGEEDSVLARLRGRIASA